MEVELGTCEHCGRDVATHSSDGLYEPVSDRFVECYRRRTDYRGRKTFAFIDPDSPE